MLEPDICIEGTATVKKPKELKACFPYQFVEKDIGMCITKGWFPTFAKACKDIDALLASERHGFHWTRVEVMFGVVRFCWGWERENYPTRVDFQAQRGVATSIVDEMAEALNGWQKVVLARKIDAITRAAEAAAKNLCAVCGEPGRAAELAGTTLSCAQCTWRSAKQSHKVAEACGLNPRKISPVRSGP